MPDPRPAPYPADTRAKGWRFELDLEQVTQSDTWALAAPDLRPWLFMVWTTAWQQVPCGSMPFDDALIAARLGMQLKAFLKAKPILMRGWWLADDGRMYHDTVVSRVADMLKRKESERTRKAEYRARMDAERKASESRGVPPVSHGTDEGRTWESGGCDATGTGTGTGLKEIQGAHPATPPPPARAHEGGAEHQTPPPGLPPPDDPTVRRVVDAVRQAGYPDVSVGDSVLRALVGQGLGVEEAVSAAQAGAKASKGWGWVMAAIEGRRRDAAQVHLEAAARAPPATVPSDAAEKTRELLVSMQLTPEQKAASAAAKQRTWQQLSKHLPGSKGATP